MSPVQIFQLTYCSEEPTSRWMTIGTLNSCFIFQSLLFKYQQMNNYCNAQILHDSEAYDKTYSWEKGCATIYTGGSWGCTQAQLEVMSRRKRQVAHSLDIPSLLRKRHKKIAMKTLRLTWWVLRFQMMSHSRTRKAKLHQKQTVQISPCLPQPQQSFLVYHSRFDCV